VTLDPRLFAPGPARDPRFDVRERWQECSNLPEGHPEKQTEFLHRQMNEEVDGMECAARLLTDFPDADWELQMCIARQCYDEARHVEMFRRAYEHRGGRVGRYPVLNFQYRIITRLHDLHARLAVQNRTFETEGVDAVEHEMQSSRLRQSEDLVRMFDAQLADEITHVRFANEFIAKAVSRDPSTVMRIGRALDEAARAFLQVMGQHAIDGASYPVNRQGRLEAGFTAVEVDFAQAARAQRRSHPLSDKP
jgi:uncharacterized ferritin-like protein (DUF455 family)